MWPMTAAGSEFGQYLKTGGQAAEDFMLEGVCNTKKMGKGAGHACVGVLGQGKSINTQYRKDVMKEGGAAKRGEEQERSS